MPQQIKRSYSEARVDLSKMTFTPDVPSAALGANEYNYGKNVETDVRGIRSISGDDPSSSSTPGIPTFVTGGFRQPVGDEVNNFFFITANEDGEWWCWNGYFWEDISPVQSTGSYTQAQNITEGWSGTVPVFNDKQNPPMPVLEACLAILSAIKLGGMAPSIKIFFNCITIDNLNC